MDSTQYNSLINNLIELIVGFENNKAYTLLFYAVNLDMNKGVVILPRSIIVTNTINIKALTKILIKFMIELEAKYGYYEPYTLMVTGKEWRTRNSLIEDVNNNLAIKVKNLELEKALSDDLYSLLRNGKKGLEYFNKCLNHMKTKSVEIRLSPHKIDRLKIITGYADFTLYEYRYISKENLKLLCLHHQNENIYYLLDDGIIISKWKDILQESNHILRLFGKNKVLFDNNLYENKIFKNIKEIELKYKFDKFRQVERHRFKNENIGVIDFETYTMNSDGNQAIYAGGWAVKSNLKMYYIEDYENEAHLIQNLFLDIFNSKLYNNYTFFIHNLSGFDYLYIFSALTKGSDKFILKPIIKDDNVLVSLTITRKMNVEVIKQIKGKKVIIKKEVNYVITLLDSFLFLPSSLRKLGEAFNCDVTKGVFPYKFISKDRINYVGNTPDYEYFSDVDRDLYNKLYPVDYIYDVKKETLKYLEKDLLSLLEIIIKFSNVIYKESQINITSCKTISGLSLKLYLSKYYDIDDNIAIIKGVVEKEIRKAYFGGSVTSNL